MAVAMIHFACAEPERYVALPLNKKPPSTTSAVVTMGLSEPQMCPLGSDMSSVNVAGGRKRASVGPPLRIPSVQPVDASHAATAPITVMDSGSVRPNPPSSTGTSRRKSRLPCNASNTGGARYPSRSDSAAPSLTVALIFSTRSSASSNRVPPTWASLRAGGHRFNGGAGRWHRQLAHGYSRCHRWAAATTRRTQCPDRSQMALRDRFRVSTDGRRSSMKRHGSVATRPERTGSLAQPVCPPGWYPTLPRTHEGAFRRASVDRP